MIMAVLLPVSHSVSRCGQRLYTTSNSKAYDITVIGGGIVGTATARELLNRHPQIRMAIVEKEDRLATHQSGHNSGVIHAGIYYTPGSLKAKLCTEGMRLAYEYFDKKNIPYKKCGKLIVATRREELKALANLYERAIQNKVPDVKVIKGSKGIKEIEPFCTGLEAIWSPHTGIVDWELVTNHYGKDFKDKKGDIFLNFEVSSFEQSEDLEYPIIIKSKANEWIKSKYVLTCGGLQSDLISELSGCSKTPKIVPFRGEYLLLKPEKCHMIKGNIYPVPDPRFPFLGVHFTPRMNGEVWLGPNAILALKREGYSWRHINMKELLDIIKYPGFQKLATKYLIFGIQETIRSFFINLQVKQLQRFIPNIDVKDVTPGPSGVRAQALDEYGNLIDDFYFDSGKGPLGKRILNCRNAPSPGATSSLAIARMIADKVEKKFEFTTV